MNNHMVGVVFQYVFIGITGLIGLSFIICNWVCAIYRLVVGHSPSLAPLVGAFFMTICLCITPFREYWWLGVVLDLSVWEILYWLLGELFRKIGEFFRKLRH